MDCAAASMYFFHCVWMESVEPFCAWNRVVACVILGNVLLGKM